MREPWEVKPGVVRRLTKAEKACKNSEYFNLRAHRRTFIDGYKKGREETLDDVIKWFKDNKSGIMGVRDTYADLWIKDLEMMKHD